MVYDKMNGYLFYQTLTFINKQYHTAHDKRQRSSFHKPFHYYCEGTPWVLLYDKLLQMTDNNVMNSFAVTELDGSIKIGTIGAKATESYSTRKTSPKKKHLFQWSNHRWMIFNDAER